MLQIHCRCWMIYKMMDLQVENSTFQLAYGRGQLGEVQTLYIVCGCYVFDNAFHPLHTALQLGDGGVEVLRHVVSSGSSVSRCNADAHIHAYQPVTNK